MVLLTLGHSRVLHLWLVDLNGVILEVKQDDGVADAELLFALFMHSLLEVGIETQHLWRVGGGRNTIYTCTTVSFLLMVAA